MGERFGAASAGGYDRGFGHVSREFIPALLRAAASAPASGCSMSPPAPGLRLRRLSKRSGRRAMWLRPTYSPPCWRRPASVWATLRTSPSLSQTAKPSPFLMRASTRCCAPWG